MKSLIDIVDIYLCLVAAPPKPPPAAVITPNLIVISVRMYSSLMIPQVLMEISVDKSINKTQ